MNADDQLLLSEGGCRQLGIVSYHPRVHEGQKPDRTALPKGDEASQGKVASENKTKVFTVHQAVELCLFIAKSVYPIAGVCRG